MNLSDWLTLIAVDAVAFLLFMAGIACCLALLTDSPFEDMMRLLFLMPPKR